MALSLSMTPFPHRRRAMHQYRRGGTSSLESPSLRAKDAQLPPRKQGQSASSLRRQTQIVTTLLA
jgi:hypothetical protein